MSTTLTRAPEVARYLEAVRSHLGALPAEERAELLDDLEAHLNEVAAAEPDVPLEQRLGTPEAYAADLLASAGLADRPAAGPAARPGLQDRLLGLRPVEVLLSHPRWRQAVAFLPELKPGWWVLRAYLVVMVFGGLGSFPFPRLFDSTVAGMLAFAAAVPASVWWARRVGPRRPRLTMVLNVALVLVTLAVAGGVRGRSGPVTYPMYNSHQGSLTGPDGTHITNIQPYDAEGRPLQGVALYDQDGRAIETGQPSQSRGNVYPLAPQPVGDPWAGGPEQGPVTTLAPPAIAPTTALPPTSVPAPVSPPTSASPPPAEPPAPDASKAPTPPG